MSENSSMLANLRTAETVDWSRDGVTTKHSLQPHMIKRIARARREPKRREFVEQERGGVLHVARTQTNEQTNTHTKQTARAGEPANRSASQHRTAAKHTIGAQRIPPVPKTQLTADA